MSRYDFFIADNADEPHTGVMDTLEDRVVQTFPLVEDPEGLLAEGAANELNEAGQ